MSNPAIDSTAMEKRRFLRVPTRRPVKLRCQDQSIRIATLCEISFSGLSLFDCDVGDDCFAIHLHLPQLDGAMNKEIALGCRLVHRTPMASGACKLGVHFDEILPEDASRLKEYLSYKLNNYCW